MNKKINQGLTYLYEGYKLLSEEFNISDIQKMLLYFEKGASKEDAPIFSAQQMQIINDAFHKGLTEAQVNIFADPIYTHKQMEQIEIALLNGYEKDQLNLFVNPIFDAEQMEQIRLGLSKYPTEYVKLYAHPDYSAKQMFQVREAFMRKITPNEIGPYLSPAFSEDHIKKLALSFEFGLTDKQVQIVARTKPVKSELHQLVNNFLDSTKEHASIDYTITQASKTKGTLNKNTSKNITHERAERNE